MGDAGGDRIRVDQLSSDRIKLKYYMCRTCFNKHCSPITVIAHLTFWERGVEIVDACSTQAIHEIRQLAGDQSFVSMVVT